VPPRFAVHGHPLVLPLFLSLVLACPRSASAQRVRVGSPAPDFTLPSLNGDSIHLADYRGHPVIINFWATWCPPCHAEMPSLAAAEREHRSSGLVVLAVNGDRESAAAMRRFTTQMELGFPLLLDARSRVNTAYAVRQLPVTVFVDSAGVVRSIVTGPIQPARFDRALRAILSEH
jgi:peroxiredoxin